MKYRKLLKGNQENAKDKNVPQGQLEPEATEMHLLLLHHVSNPPNRVNQSAFKVLVDLLTEIIDIDVNHIGHGIEMVIPDMFGNHRPGEDFVRIPHHVFEEGIFFAREFDLLVLPGDSVGDQGKGEIPDREDGFLLRFSRRKRARTLAKNSAKAKGLVR